MSKMIGETHASGFDAVRSEIRRALCTSAEGFAAGLLCGGSERDVLEKEFSDSRLLQDEVCAKKKFRLVILDDKAEKHKLKRQLNEQGCECIVYTDAFSPMVYEILNDGTTPVSHTFRLEDYDIVF